jgi:hypothetical protein
VAIVTLFDQPDVSLPKGFFPNDPVEVLPRFRQRPEEKLLHKLVWGAGNDNRKHGKK